MTLMIPAAVSAIALSLYPFPSRVTDLSKTREIETAGAISGCVTTAVLITSAVDSATQPDLLAFEQAATSHHEHTGRWGLKLPRGCYPGQSTPASLPTKAWHGDRRPETS